LSGRIDFYEILRVNRLASSDEIKAAYRARAKELHPDANTGGGVAAKFSELTQAYEALSNPERRACYDTAFYDDPEPQRAQKPRMVERCRPSMLGMRGTDIFASRSCKISRRSSSVR
jgi:curved DNA-binding protein CbpA